MFTALVQVKIADWNPIRRNVVVYLVLMLSTTIHLNALALAAVRGVVQLMGVYVQIEF